jgi:trans-aconitate 2-methyltransferase
VRAVGGDDGGQLWNFAGIDETTHRLQRAGFTVVEVGLVADSAVLNRAAQFEAFLATVMLGAQLRGLAAHQRRPFVRAVAEQLDEPVIDYVRLQIDAIRA